MNATLFFIRETNNARLYMDSQCKEFWVPRSVITHTTKYPPADELDLAKHIVTIEDWWWTREREGGWQDDYIEKTKGDEDDNS